jgi:hypothetical protein
MKSVSLIRVCTVGFLVQAASAAAEMEYWFYRSTNLLVDEQRDKTIELIQRAAKAGYTHCLLADSKFSRLWDSELPKRYFENAAQLKAAAVQAKITLVPALFSIGYSNDLLFQDPNLIEALPVKNLEMIVGRDGTAKLPEPSGVLVKNGDFAEGMKGWAWKDETITVADGMASARDPNGKNARISQEVALEPWRQYHFQVRVKTKAFKGTPEAKFISGERTLNHDYLKVAQDQDWQVHHVVFNSQEKTKAQLYLGCWDGTTGELAWDDAKLEVVSFVNLVRRPGAPLRVMKGGLELREGTDFEPLADPLLGTKPYPGCYTVWHEPPVLKIKNQAPGTAIQVSYHHGATVHDDQANICVSEGKTWEILRDQARRMHDLWGAPGYMMSFDEIRVFNHCEGCRRRNLDSGRLLADAAAKAIGLLRGVNPGGKIYVWNDMFDPHHNARANYYLASGDYTNSWQGLAKDVIVIPWYYEKRNESLEFFSQRGHSQIMAGYYDGNAAENAKGWMQAATQHPESVKGIMYTTWRSDYSQLEAFIAAVRGDK